MKLYREKLLAHYKNPQNYKKLSNPTNKGRSTNASCGDAIELELYLENDRVKQVGFQGSGCVLTTAVMSILSEELRGKNIKEIKELNEKDIDDLIGFPISPGRLKCLYLPLKAVKDAIQ